MSCVFFNRKIYYLIVNRFYTEIRLRDAEKSVATDLKALKKYVITGTE